MRLFARVLVPAIGALGLLAASAASAGADEGGNLTDFSSMTPVTGAAVGTVNDRGIKGGGLPWVITSGTGTVSLQGDVDVTVTGLVIPVLGNRNPVPFFKATVSCLGPSGVVNVSTGNFPATLAGNAHIQAVIDLPRPCKQPIIFVAAPTGQWFAESNPDTQP
jgi:hypothetical protein